MNVCSYVGIAVGCLSRGTPYRRGCRRKGRAGVESSRPGRALPSSSLADSACSPPGGFLPPRPPLRYLVVLFPVAALRRFPRGRATPPSKPPQACGMHRNPAGSPRPEARLPTSPAPAAPWDSEPAAAALSRHRGDAELSISAGQPRFPSQHPLPRLLCLTVPAGRSPPSCRLPREDPAGCGCPAAAGGGPGPPSRSACLTQGR